MAMVEPEVLPKRKLYNSRGHCAIFLTESDELRILSN